MKKQRINVWDYQDAVHGGNIWHAQEEEKSYDVDAFCVGGDEGVYAIFENPIDVNTFCIAYGDDGHWYITGRFGKSWIKEIISKLQLYEKDL